MVSHNPNPDSILSTMDIRNWFRYLTIIFMAMFFSILYLLGPPLGMGPENVISQKCDPFKGEWVYDNQSHPLYKENECTFMSDYLACQKFGRKDLSYQFWRWQPFDCDLPRLNGKSLLERLRNKKMVFVGDSLNIAQWISMVCLVEANIPPHLKSMYTHGSFSTFKAIEYNATIEFYWEPYLVESNSDDPVNHSQVGGIVRTEAIEKHGRHWTDGDFLIFDCYLWWRTPIMMVLWGNFESGDGIYKQVEMLKAYEMALRTWSDWLDIHVNRSKTQIFWTTMSSTHERSEDWGGKSGLNCYNETQPIFKQDYWGSGSYLSIMRLVESEIERLSIKGLNIRLLNITQLSEYRKDAHLSIYRLQSEPIAQEQLANPHTYADCFHWCLPGVPDTWNEILYAYIFNYL